MWHCHPLRDQFVAPDGWIWARGAPRLDDAPVRPGKTRRLPGPGASRSANAANEVSHAADATTLPFLITLDFPLGLPKPKHGIHVPKV